MDLTTSFKQSLIDQAPWFVVFIALWILFIWAMRKSRRQEAERNARMDEREKALDAKLDQLLERDKHKDGG